MFLQQALTKCQNRKTCIQRLIVYSDRVASALTFFLYIFTEYSDYMSYATNDRGQRTLGAIFSCL